MSAWSGPFAWLVLAEPVMAGQLGDLTEEVSLAQLNAQRSDSPPAQLAAQRLSARHAELRQATATGLWSVRLMAGGPAPQAGAQVAGLLCASADLDGLPYALAPVGGSAGLEEILESSFTVGHNLPAAVGAGQRPPPGTPLSRPRARDTDIAAPAWPFFASSRLVAAVARPPARELPGIRFVLRPDFDVTPETIDAERAGEIIACEPAVPVGTVLDWNRVPAGELAVPRASLNRHVFGACGATGAGKSQTVRGLLEAATRAGIPWLVVEPAKAEYRLMAARLPGNEVIRIRPGELGDPPAGINPLEPAPAADGTRFPLQAHADLVRALFLAAFEASEPFPQVLAAALTRCYENAGWDLVTGEPATPGLQPGYPALEDLQATAIHVVNEIGYGREVTDNVRGFVTVRISSLRQGTAGRFFQGGHPLDFTRLLGRNVVVEIEDTGDDGDKAFLMGTVLIRLAEHRRMRQRAEGATARSAERASAARAATTATGAGARSPGLPRRPPAQGAASCARFSRAPGHARCARGRARPAAARPKTPPCAVSAGKRKKKNAAAPPSASVPTAGVPAICAPVPAGAADARHHSRCGSAMGAANCAAITPWAYARAATSATRDARS